ncbi:MAG: hypothetical protein PVH00_08070 [Gemmatimonadota bacterium]|jgi:hypothetical protein
MDVPELRITITRRTDGGAVLRCVRADGTETWQHQRGRQAAFFPLHDLTHLSVESSLGFRRGFFGLIAEGWDIEDTGGKGERGALPPEAAIVEHLVGSLDLERAGTVHWTAARLHAQASLFATGRGLPSPPPLTDATLDHVRDRIRELHHRWIATPPGQTLELSFDRR